MSESGPYFHGWCEEAHRVDAFAAALAALIIPGTTCSVTNWPLGSDRTSRTSIALDESIAFTRAVFTADAHVSTSLGVRVSLADVLPLTVRCFGEAYLRRYPDAPLQALVYDRNYFFFRQVELVLGNGPRSQAVEAAYVSIHTQADTERILLGLCAPDEIKRVRTGSCSPSSCAASVEVCSTYHSDATEIARDLALSWVHLYDGDKVGCAAGLSLEALAERVEAAPKEARVGIATTVERVEEYERRDYQTTKSWATRAPRPDLARKGSREIGPGDKELTREQVLAVLQMPPAALLDALEAAAVPDDEWREAEAVALEMIEA
ncbi:MAG: hypothetical protein HUU21_41185, partial [Polyangiaceae bacterium]|nr:hypothetical protein [Polyangiaceae bacterium]